MTDKFITDKWEIDLSGVPISYERENPWFTDDFTTTYSFPFTLQMTAELRLQLGHLDSIRSRVGVTQYKGMLLLEGRLHKAKLKLLSAEGDKVEAQLEAEGEVLNNFYKKLSDLPLLKKQVVSLAQDAEEVFPRTYPWVEYNYPMIYYPKETSETGWGSYRGFLNHQEYGRFVKNEVGGDGEEIIRNLYQPMAYLLYVLKAGFAQAGYELRGDILEDRDLQTALIYNGTPYWREVQQEELRASTAGVAIEEDPSTRVKRYKSVVTLPVAGKWRIVSDHSHLSSPLSYTIKVGGKTVREEYFPALAIGERNTGLHLKEEFTAEEENTELELLFEGKYNDLLFHLNVIGLHDDSGNVVRKLYQEKEIDLKRCMPDITFGDLLRTLKNWKNYDVKLQGNIVEMNLIKVESGTLHDGRSWGVWEPKRTFSENKRFRLRFVELDKEADNYPTVYFGNDEAGGRGMRLEKYKKREEGQTHPTGVTAHEIEINGYVLRASIREHKACFLPLKEGNSVLGLIPNIGLQRDPSLVGKSSNLVPPGIVQYLSKWYQFRVSEETIEWTFTVKKNLFRDVEVRDRVWVYGGIYLIKNISKTGLTRELYQVTLTMVNIASRRATAGDR